MSEREAQDEGNDEGTGDDRNDEPAQDASDGQDEHDGAESDQADDEQADTDSDDSEQDGPSSQVVEVAPDPGRTGIEIEKPERADSLSADELEEIRQERLDPDNRPDNVEVDNTQRDFDTNTGKFTDSDMEEDVGPFDEDAV
jgi:hypothetical protein